MLSPYCKKKRGENVIASIYLLLTDNKTTLSRCIQYYTRTSFNHSSIALDFSLSHVYSFGRKEYFNPLNGGFVKENFYHSWFLQSNCKIYKFDISENQKHHIERILENFEKNKYLYRYNFFGLISIPFNKNWGRENTFFCSQFIAYLLEEIGVTLIEKPNYLITPVDLVLFLKPQLIYSGKVSDYLNKTTSVVG